MPAVNAIAKAPQNVTRTVALAVPAPPALAPSAPSRANEINDVTATAGPITSLGRTKAVSRGKAARIAKVAADVRAACTDVRYSKFVACMGA